LVFLVVALMLSNTRWSCGCTWGAPH